jgi:hypothetical protein
MARNLEFKLILDALGFQRGAEQAGSALKKLGQEVKGTGASMKPLADNLGFMGGVVQKLSSPLGLATVGVGALGTAAAAAATGVARLAAEAEKLSNASVKTGVGLDALQRYQRTAENMGASLDSVTGAINKMQRSLQTSPDALRKVGIEVERLVNLRPEQQFEEMARQIAAMDQPTQRTAAAMAAFGRSGAELLPVLLKIGSEGTDAIVTMSDSQIQALTDVDDRLDDLKGSWKDFINQLLAGLGALGGSNALSMFAAGLRGVAQYIKEITATGFISDLMGGTLLKNLLDASNRSGMYQGRKVDNSAASIFRPQSLYTPMDPMAALALMDRQNPLKLPTIPRPAKSNMTVKGGDWGPTNEELWGPMTVKGGIAGPPDSLFSDFDQRLRAGDMLPSVGGKGLWTKYQDVIDNELDNALPKVTRATIDWSNVLNDLANQFQILGGITGGLAGKISGLIAGLAGGAAGMMAGLSTFKNAQKVGGIEGFLGKLGGIGGIAASAIGIGKSIIGLFKSDPVKKAQKEAGKALGMNISREMAEAFAEQAKAQGKSVKEVAKAWLAEQAKELRSSGIQKMRTGVEGMMGMLGVSPELTRIAAGNFAHLFWATVKDEGWVAATEAYSDIFSRLKEFFGENMPESLKGIGALMGLAQNEAVAPYLQASQAQQQFVTGAMEAGIYDPSMQGDSVVVAKETVSTLRANGATDQQAYQAIGGLLKANLNAAIASGRGISEDLQALLDEARANGVDIVADIGVQQLEVLRAIYSQLGGLGTPGINAGGAPVEGGGVSTPEGPSEAIPISTPMEGVEGVRGRQYYAAAEGFSGWVNRPTKFLAGEAGPEHVQITPKGERGGAGSSITFNPTFHIDPLQSNAARSDLAKFMIAEFISQARNSPMIRQVLRQDGGR